MVVIKLDSSNFKKEISEGKPILVDFGAEWCGPCKMLAPVLEDISEEEKDFRVGNVDIAVERELAGAFGVMSIPTLILFKEGAEVDRLIGAYPEEIILKWVKEKI